MGHPDSFTKYLVCLDGKHKHVILHFYKYITNIPISLIIKILECLPDYCLIAEVAFRENVTLYFSFRHRRLCKSSVLERCDVF